MRCRRLKNRLKFQGAEYHVAYNGRLAGWLPLVLATILAAGPALAAGSEERRSAPAESERTIPAEMENGDAGVEAESQPVEAETDSAEPLAYSENQGWQDFEVHFLVSLPFTALYSYLSLSALDAAVQGRFPAEFRQTDMWMVIGMAVGSSLAIALGSLNRVPDQSQDLLPQGPSSGRDGDGMQVGTLVGVEIRF